MLKLIAEEFKLPAPPFWLIGGLLILLSLFLVPLALIARARVSSSTKPRPHMILDMDRQTKLKAQADSTVFADGRAMRPPVPGTVAWGPDAGHRDPDNLKDDDHYFRGYKLVNNPAVGGMDIEYFTGFPDRVTVDKTLLRRGQERFNIYCMPCHGYGGKGDGPIHQRALKIKALWVQPSNLTDADRSARPEGHLFNTITHGIRNMAGYGAQIPVADRWAIVAYLRALQLGQNAPVSKAGEAPEGAVARGWEPGYRHGSYRVQMSMAPMELEFDVLALDGQTLAWAVPRITLCLLSPVF
jgi:mono/diheme cytochrome c family protein